MGRYDFTWAVIPSDVWEKMDGPHRRVAMIRFPNNPRDKVTFEEAAMMTGLTKETVRRMEYRIAVAIEKGRWDD